MSLTFKIQTLLKEVLDEDETNRWLFLTILNAERRFKASHNRKNLKVFYPSFDGFRLGAQT